MYQKGIVLSGSVQPLAYDNHIVNLVLNGIDDPRALHTMSDALIANRGWRRDLMASAGGEIAVDLFAMAGGIRGQVGSLKECACKLDACSLRTLPFAPDRHLSHEDMPAVVAYNGVDLDVTALVGGAQAEKIASRIALSREYSLPALICAPDAKMAEIILAKQLFGRSYPTYPKVRTWALAAAAVTQKFAFHTPALQELLTRIPDMEFCVEVEEPRTGRSRGSMSASLPTACRLLVSRIISASGVCTVTTGRCSSSLTMCSPS